jgi:hypothetical protein
VVQLIHGEILQSGIHTSCSSESSNFGFDHFIQTADMDKEAHTNRFIVHDLVSGHQLI